MKVIVIDDDEFSLYFTRFKLMDDKFTEDIQTFLSAEEGLAYFTECKDEDIPEVILLDLNMPVMDGWQFLKAFAPLWPRFKERCSIYILTSSLDSADQIRADKSPMVSGFFDKPIHSEDLMLMLSHQKNSSGIL